MLTSSLTAYCFSVKYTVIFKNKRLGLNLGSLTPLRETPTHEAKKPEMEQEWHPWHPILSDAPMARDHTPAIKRIDDLLSPEEFYLQVIAPNRPVVLGCG